MAADFEEAEAGSLVADIKLCKAKIADLIRRCAAAGGDMQRTLTPDTTVTWSGAIRSEQAHLRRMEATEATMAAMRETDPQSPTELHITFNEIEGVGLDDV